MTAQALEQSVLKSKDKAQLIAIAEALGVKANSRTKKADLIDEILTKTGGNTSADAAAPAAAPKNDAPASGDDATGSAPKSSAPKAPTPPAEPADEPKAEWELALDLDGGGDEPAESKQSDRSGDASSASGDQQSRGDDQRTSDDRGGRNKNDGQQNDQQSKNDGGQKNDGQSKGDGQGGQNKNDGNKNRQNNNQNNQQGNNDGDGSGRSKRRRRRRKGRGGQDGPQGEDRDLLDGDDDNTPTSNEPVKVEGYLDMRDEGYGFLRVNNYLASKSDSYIPVKLSRQFGLRKGDHVVGMSRPAGRNEKNPAMLEIQSVNGRPPEQAKKRARFEDLTALFPDSKLRLEDPSDPTNMTARIIDLVSPIGKGQRGLIVSPPKAGKTTVMKTIVASIEKNNPECKTIVLLIDERPEEVTEFKRSVRGEVIASTFDKPSDQHTQIAEMAIEKAKRMVEYGEDVVIILDGITRLSRAYNLAAPASGRILSGGIDAGALYPPKRFFGAARNVEEGGSLTILATALVETNSRMDEAVFEEFKGTGNMELRLDRKLAERRIYPAIDVDASSTRHEELLFDRKQLQMVWKLRRVLSGLAADGNAAPGLELLVDRLKTFRTNDEFLTEIAKQPGM
ncbi:MAG: transcription termination factor Rho [Ilumatobacter fluminis]|uniref:transcription termination factor Rho n=1 Tax=Ilumatobacter fluminis TaxID=467091 RepID=UPI0032EF7316